MDDYLFSDNSDSLPDWSSAFDFSPWNPSGESFIGEPGSHNWVEQTTPFTCAVVSQQMILAQFGIQVSEAQLTYDATVNGWLSSSGTSPEDLGALLEYYGVSTHTGTGDGVNSLINELAQGRKVIVAVDSGEMWGTDFFFSDWLDPFGADHAIVVTGMDVSDPDNIQVYVNDPGDPSGAGRPYPLDQFMNAWNDSGQYYVATDQAPAGLGEDRFFGSNYNPETGWYMNPEFWQQIISGFAGAMAVGDMAYEFTGDEAIGMATAGAVTLFATFDALIEHMPEEELNELLYNI